MITHLRIENFKSWANTGEMHLAPITGLFGANSSGKSSVLQFLLALKQTVESTDRTRVLHLGDERSLVDLGTFYDVMHGHKSDSPLSFDIGWKFRAHTIISGPDFILDRLRFEASIRDAYRLIVERFSYRLDSMSFGLEHAPLYKLGNTQTGEAYANVDTYLLKAQGYEPQSREEMKEPLGVPLPPIHFYGFPDIVYAYYTNVRFLADLALHLEQLFDRIYYLGPLREYPERLYTWGGEIPRDVGRRGELAIQALLASRSFDPFDHRSNDVELRVVEQLKHMGLLQSFELKRIAEHRKEFEVKVRKNAQSSEVLLTDVGFGVSQVLPVLVLCYYVPEGSILLLEQPEIHLHPSVQAALADVFIDVAKTRNVQIILESHSEHLLRRLQRRIAEQQLTTDQTALYFCEIENGASKLIQLELDEYGNISNWPEDFFGDDMGEATAKTVAEMERRKVIRRPK